MAGTTAKGSRGEKGSASCGYGAAEMGTLEGMRIEVKLDKESSL